MDGLLQDLRLALRSLRRGGLVPLLAVACLALGIGLNTSVFTVVNGVLYRSLPLEDGERLVAVHGTSPLRGVDEAGVTFADLAALREMEVFGAVEGLQERTFTLTGGEQAERVEGYGVTPGLFSTLGVEPVLGRSFRPGEGAEPGFEEVAVISDALWHRRFAGDAGVLGSPIHLNGRELTVVGVMPPGFRFPESEDLWVPLEPVDWTDGSRRAVAALARLAPGVELPAARERVASLARRMAAERAETHRGWDLLTRPLRDTAVDEGSRRALELMLGAVFFVLLVACVNVANLLLARSSEREREVAVRSALGATRGRVVRQLLTEALVLAVAGAAGGWLLALWFVDATLARIPEDLAYWMRFDLDGTVLAFTGALTVVTALVFGILPAVRASRSDLSRGMGSRGSVGATGRILSTLVGVEVALSLVLLVGAGVMVRSFLQVESAAIGMPDESTLSMRMVLSGDRYDPLQAKVAFFEGAVERISALPSVAGAAAVSAIPADDGGPAVRVRTDPGTPEESAPMATLVGATGGSFEALGVSLLAGREFTPGEARDTAAAVTVVGETLARRLWPGGDAVGRSLLVDDTELRVVGVAPDIVYEELNEQTEVSRLQVHVPYSLLGWRGMALLVRGRGDAAALTSSVLAELRELEPMIAPWEVMTMEERRRFTSWQQRFFGGLFAQFGLVALVLAASGVYGVVAYGVARRRRELGVRVALGAPDRTVLGGVVKASVVPAAAGIVVGLMGAWAVSRLLGGLVYGVDPADPLSFGAAAGAMALVALVASWVPARRALRVDPAEVLRAE